MTAQERVVEELEVSKYESTQIALQNKLNTFRHLCDRAGI